MMWYWNGGWSWWGWLGMILTMLLVWGLLIWGAVALLQHRYVSNQTLLSSPPARSIADEILAARFARGEISEDEFVHKREVLGDSGTSTVPADTDQRARRGGAATASR